MPDDLAQYPDEQKPTPDATTTPRRSLDIALSVGAVVGTLCIVFALCATLFSLTPLVFRSGSMEPAIPTGSLALARDVPAAEIAEGDVLSVLRTDGSRITHRVEQVDGVFGETAVLIMKGDANDAADPDPYIVADASRVIGHVPYAGYAASWLSTPYAWVVGGGLALALLYLVFRPEKVSAPHGPAPVGRHRAVPAAAVALVAIVVVPGYGGTESTLAQQGDSAQASGTVTAATLLPPATFRCDNFNANTVRFTFPQRISTGATFGYRIGPRGGTSTNITPPTSGPVVFDMSRSLLGGLLNFGTVQVDLFTTLGTWTSPTAITQVINYPLLGGLRCGTNGGVVSLGGAPAARSFGAFSAPAPNALNAPETVLTQPAPTTSAAPTSEAPGSTAPSASSSSPTPSGSAPSSPPPSTTTPPPPPTTTTAPPPPASAFVADGGSATSGGNTAAVSGGTLTITNAEGTVLTTRPVTTSARYGTGVVFSSTGDLYVLSDSGVTRIMIAGGTATASAAEVDSLPADIRALL